MAVSWSTEATYPSSHQGNLASSMNKEFTHVDFLPDIREAGGVFSQPVYDTFRTLIERANQWLKSHPKWKIVTCESVEFKANSEKVDVSTMTYMEYGEASTKYIRGLRLWLTLKKDESDRPQQIGYLNMIPRQKEERGMFSSSKYETLDELISRFNSMMDSNPIPGRVITIESQEMKVPPSNNLDADRSSWLERGSAWKNFLFVIRIFYEIMDGTPEYIGMKDFAPDTIREGGIFTLPKYEPFSNVVKKASAWCSQQQDIRICNAQSIEIKMKRGKEIDTQKMSYFESGSMATFYIRILRVAYMKAPSYYNGGRRTSLLTQMTCKTFVPVQLTDGLFLPEFETLEKTMERVSSWVKATGAIVLSAETAALRMFTGGEAKYGTEASLTYNPAERNEYWIFVIRLYLNGKYNEPPPEMLPPVPQIEQRDCCNVQ